MRIAVTRTAEGGERLAAALRGAGFDAVLCPLVQIVEVAGPPLHLDGYDWVVLTSARATEVLLRRAQGPLPRVATVGAATAEPLRAVGIEPALVARRSTQEGLLEELRPLLGPSARVLFVAAEDARDVVAGELGADVVVAYRTEPLRPASFPEVELVTLASGSAARSFAALGIARPCVSIGPITTAEARAAGLEVLAEAETHDLEGLVAAARLAASLLASSPS